MKILKALQRKKQEEQNKIIPFQKNNRNFDEDAKSFLFTEDLKIGAPQTFEASITTEELEQTQQNTKLPKFTTWTVEPKELEPRLVSIKTPQSKYCESYRALRTQIFQGQKNKLKKITISSVNPNEGKSITAINLAWLMAQTEGNSVLLIDGDLRKPSLANYLGFKTDKGLSDLISADASLQESITRLEPSGLHLIAGGSIKPNASEMISGTRFREIISELHRIFDYILIDSPPLSTCSDANVFTNLSDALILVVRSGWTNHSDIVRNLENIPPEKIIGVVLNESEDMLREYYDSDNQSSKQSL